MATVHLPHLEEESTKKDKKVESKDPDSINGVMEEFMVHLARAVKDTQVEEKHCYHHSSPEHFIHDCPLVRASRENMQLNCKEETASKKGEAFAMPWVNARVAHLLSVCRAAATMVIDETSEDSSLNGYDEVVIAKNAETRGAFSSQVIPVKAEKAYTGECINIMTQGAVDQRWLSTTVSHHSKCIHLRKGSKNEVVVVRNSTAYPKLSRRKLLWPGQ